MFGKIGVNLFIIITGYYEVREGFKLRKAMKIEAETLLVSYILTAASVAISVCLFCCAVMGRQRECAAINILASGAFADYLIQEHIIFKNILYFKIARTDSYCNSAYLPLVFVILAAALLLSGVVCHAVYLRLERLLMPRLFEKSVAWDKKIKQKVYGCD